MATEEAYKKQALEKSLKGLSKKRKAVIKKGIKTGKATTTEVAAALALWEAMPWLAGGARGGKMLRAGWMMGESAEQPQPPPPPKAVAKKKPAARKASKKKKKAQAGWSAEELAILAALGIVGFGTKKAWQKGKKVLETRKAKKAAAEQQLEYIKKHGERGATKASEESAIATKLITTPEGEALSRVTHTRGGQRIGKPRPPAGVKWRKSGTKGKLKKQEDELNRLLKVEQGFKKIIKRLESKGQDTTTAKANMKKTEDALTKLIEEMTK